MVRIVSGMAGLVSRIEIHHDIADGFVQRSKKDLVPGR